MTAERLVVDVRVPLDRFELSVRFETRSHVIGLWGPSGSGKTTVLEVVAGLRRGASGRVVFGSRVWLDTSQKCFVRPERRDLGYVPQDSLLFSNLDVRGNLLAGARRARRSGANADTVIERAARTVQIQGLLDRDVTTLSGGERQRVAVARALCSAPSLLVLDEPFAALDLALRRSMLPVLLQVRDEFQLPILFVSHDPTEMQILCDEVLAIRDGTVVGQGPPHEVLAGSSALLLAQGHSFENVIRGRIDEFVGQTARVRLGDGASPEAMWIDVVDRPAPMGAEVFVGLSSKDILLAKGDLGALSARNRLVATISGIEQVGDWCLVRALVRGVSEHLVIEVTPAACTELDLAPGDSVKVVFKASACSVYSLNGR